MDEVYEYAMIAMDMWQTAASVYSTTFGTQAVTQAVISATLGESKAKRSRLSTRKNPRDSPWMQALQLSDFTTDDTRDAIKFRQRNRIPVSMFFEFVKFALAQFPPKSDASGRIFVPMELKVLGFFRFIAVNIGWDYISELSFVGIETHRNFAKKFALKVKQLYGPEWIRYPTTAREISLATQPFSILGLPGCVTQIDCTHVVWHQCPRRMRTSCTRFGFKKTTLSFLVANTFDTSIQHVSSGYPGTYNDKTIASLDPFCDAMVRQGLYSVL
jgi:hypothetical protein